MQMYVECDHCRFRFVMRTPAKGGLVRVACPSCHRSMVLVLHGAAVAC